MSSTRETAICLSLETNTWHEVCEVARACERAGIVAVAPGDSPLHRREMYLSCAAAALSTTETRIMTSVTNPVTRHPSVAAASAVTLNDVAPGRIGIGIATGDSAAWGVGLKPAKLERLREYILALKALLAGEEATWCGQPFRGAWVDWRPPTSVPIYVACAGPKVLQMAVEVADGLILATGYSPEDIAATHELVETACARAGRDPRELDIWWYSEVTFAENIETGLAASLIWFAQWLVMGSMRGKRIPEAFKPKLRELTADSFHVSTRGKGKERGRAMVERAKQLGLFDWLVSRSSRLCGSVDEVRTRMAELRSLGVEQLVLFPYGCDGDTFNTIESLAEARR